MGNISIFFGLCWDCLKSAVEGENRGRMAQSKLLHEYPVGFKYGTFSTSAQTSNTWAEGLSSLANSSSRLFSSNRMASRENPTHALQEYSTNTSFMHKVAFVSRRFSYWTNKYRLLLHIICIIVAPRGSNGDYCPLVLGAHDEGQSHSQRPYSFTRQDRQRTGGYFAHGELSSERLRTCFARELSVENWEDMHSMDPFRN